MIGALVNKPNHVRERQVLVQSSNKPVYLRLPRSRLYFGSYLAVFGLGMVGTSYGLFNLIKAGHKSYLPCIRIYTNPVVLIGQGPRLKR
ncbi:unnamed protein product [Rhizoctonia solani]|uniref:Uncharacterized protein n=1 Tax=Rhizoctonia solani TaxID=456999 RepID=A0A8H3DMV1_9AGAM|nr:unnamed protein product [Rhizoctonia solani]